jgi:putative hydrolase of HD superfamily
MILIHDLPEVYAGDHFAWKGPLEGKHEKEKNGLEKILQNLPKQTQTYFQELWLEFEENQTAEAKLAHALDKLEVVIQHNEADIVTWHEKEYEMNVTYGTEQCVYNPLLQQLRDLVRHETSKKMKSRMSRTDILNKTRGAWSEGDKKLNNQNNMHI